MSSQHQNEEAPAGQELPEALRAEVADWRQALTDLYGNSALDDVPLDGVSRLVAASPFAADVMRRYWPTLRAELGKPYSPEAVAAALRNDMAPESQRAAVLRSLRAQRNCSLVRILWQDYVEQVAVDTTLGALSSLAEVCLDGACAYSRDNLARRFGEPLVDGSPQPLIVLAMGKLGGRELNFSSDIDLVFLYPVEGETSGPKQTSAHEFFARLARQAVALLEEATSEGFVYRVDTRLRPFGNSGPPVVSFAALENYLVEHGRGWERYAYVKARPVTETATEPAADRLIAEIVTPFVYRRYLDYGVFESLREMQAMIAREVAKRRLADNVKLGPGGIREIEFIVQSLQLVRGGTMPALRTQCLRSAVRAATDDRDLDAKTAQALLDAYDFLRRVENAIQASRDQQSHSLPTTDLERLRLAYALRFADWPSLEAELRRTREWVSEQFRELGAREQVDGSAVATSGSTVPSLWAAAVTEDEWLPCLASLGIDDVDQRAIASVLVGLSTSPAVARIESTAADRLQRFIEGLLSALPACSRPAVAARRVARIAESVLRRSAYLALLNENPAVLRRLVDLCASSAFLAREIAGHPVLLDELIDARVFEAALTSEELRADLEARLGRTDPDDAEVVIEALAKFKRVSMFRLAVADFSGTIPLMKVSDRLTELAELILTRILDMARADVIRQFGTPTYRVDGELYEADIGIIAYGKLAGYELAYASDLDLVFLHDSHGDQQETDGSRAIDNQVFFSRLARRLLHYLTAQTGSGALYEIDTRLRPSGKAGLLVTSIDAFRRYQQDDAWTWEHQALLRSRPVAGSANVAARFVEIRQSVLRDPNGIESLREDVLDMRSKMRKQLDRSDADHFDLKQGEGGIGDIEFLVQYLVLKHAPDRAEVIEYTDNIRQLDALLTIGHFDDAEVQRLQDIYRAYRGMAHRLSLDDQPALAASDAFLDERNYVTRVWHKVFLTDTDG